MLEMSHAYTPIRTKDANEDVEAGAPRAEPAKSNEIMGAQVKQSGEQFGKSSAYLRWQDKTANQKFFAGELTAFMKDSEKILLEAGVIRKALENFAVTFDGSFIK